METEQKPKTPPKRWRFPFWPAKSANKSFDMTNEAITLHNDAFDSRESAYGSHYKGVTSHPPVRGRGWAYPDTPRSLPRTSVWTTNEITIMTPMDPAPRHHCLIYKGAPSKHLPALAASMREKLRQNHRCLYLNSPPMVAGLRSYLAAAGVEVAQEVARGRLILTSDQQHLADGSFDIDRMLMTLENLLNNSLRDRYTGLWAVGDMTWELGPLRDPARLLEYEWRLEKMFHQRPELSGICQYHADTLPREMMRQSLLVHPSIYVNQTLSLINPYYLHSEARANEPDHSASLDPVISRLCESGDLSQA
jgi:hypothetical protein